TLYRLPVLGGVPTKMRDNIGTYFTLAPDNQRVAFLRNDENSASVIVSNLDGGNERAVLTLPNRRNLMALCLAWSPDGSTIAISASAEDNAKTSGIFLLNVKSGELKPLTTQQWIEIARLAWLQDGSGVLAIATPIGANDYRQIWLATYPGGETRSITS